MTTHPAHRAEQWANPRSNDDVSNESRTPQTWPPDRQPTAQEWVEWLLIASDDERAETFDRIIRADAAAHQCFIRNHDGLEKDRDRWRTEALHWREVADQRGERLSEQAQRHIEQLAAALGVDPREPLIAPTNPPSLPSGGGS